MYKIKFVILLTYNFLFSQNQISLPKIEKNNYRVYGMPYHSITISHDNIITFDKDTVKVNEIKERLLDKYKNSDFDYTVTFGESKNIHLFIDVNSKFNFFDKVFTEISSTVNPVVILRGNFENTTNSYDIIGLKTKLAPSFYKFSAPKYQFTNQEIEEANIKTQNSQDDFPPIPKISRFPIKNLTTAIYSIQQEIIDEQLINKKIECIKVTNEGLIVKDRKISFENREFWTGLESNFNVVFITFEEDLLYSNYIEYIKTRPINFNLINTSNIELVELSSQILEIHKRAKIKICDCVK
jgi:hypothetical protein